MTSKSIPQNPQADQLIDVRDKRKRGWFSIDNEIIDEVAPAIGAYAFCVYASLLRHAGNNNGDSFPCISTIAKEFTISVNTVKRAIKTLVKHKLLIVRSGKSQGVANRYYILDYVGGSSVGTRGVVPTELGGRPVGTTEEYPYKKTQLEKESSAASKDAPKPSKFPQSTEVKNAFAILCYGNLKAWDLNASTMAAALGKLSKAENRSLEVQDLRDFRTWWKANDWRGKQRQLPEPYTVVQVWARFRAGDTTTELDAPKPQTKRRIEIVQKGE